MALTFRVDERNTRIGEAASMVNPSITLLCSVENGQISQPLSAARWTAVSASRSTVLHVFDTDGACGLEMGGEIDALSFTSLSRPERAIQIGVTYRNMIGHLLPFSLKNPL